MATKITTSDELQITLTDAGGTYWRTLKIPNPRTAQMNRAAIVAALAPAMTATLDESTKAPFFFDDNDPDVGLTEIAEIQHVVTRREETNIE